MAAVKIDTFLEAVADEDQTIMPELEVITTRTGHQAIYVGRCKNKHDQVVDAYVCPVGKTNVRAFETRIQKGKVLQEALAEYHIRMVAWADESLDYHKYFATHQAASKFGNGYEAHKKWMLAIWRKNVEHEYPGVNRATSYGGDDDDSHLKFQGKDNGKGKTTTSDERCVPPRTEGSVSQEFQSLQRDPTVTQMVNSDAKKAKGDPVKNTKETPTEMSMSPAEDWKVHTSRVLPPLPEKLKPIEAHYCRLKRAREADVDVKVQMAKEKRIKHEPQPSEDSDEENDLLQLMRNAGDKTPDSKPYQRHPLEIAHLIESTRKWPIPGAPRLGTMVPGGNERRSGSEEWDFSKRLKTIRNPAFRDIVSKHMKGTLRSPELSYEEEIAIVTEMKGKQARMQTARPTIPTKTADNSSKKRNRGTLQIARAKEQISDAHAEKKEVRRQEIRPGYAEIPGLMHYLGR
ncbi:hypothetical protein LTR56_013988 [Elasticomyces elasticus]|nr:hypothetical protein LTR56_013988 [Elasticomyces elasticus]KAK3651783.1 hypothetical protein LTR22_011952 [Elasticomyces elasticus]KAK4902388.1 hypothetical protein LTR49_027096 [Elasticomyces elasticus]KAK5752478.1 hypothetical protein LTS12_017415 [Elasticomyces elasticus]